MWYETALQQLGLEKSIDLDISLVPNSDESTLKRMRHMLSNMGRISDEK